MKVLINAASVKEGGSKVVLLRLLTAMQAERPDFEWIVAAHPGLERELRCIPSVNILPLPWFDGGALGFLRWYEWELPRALRRLGADVLFSQTNYLPMQQVCCPTLLLEQHAGHFSALFNALIREELGSPLARMWWGTKRLWVRCSVERATAVTVQTAALADSIARETRRPRGRIRVIHHGAGIAAHTSAPRIGRRDGPWRVGYITKYGVQKDFDVLFRAVRILSEEGRQIRIVLTLDPAFEQNRRVLSAARSMGLEGSVENHGELSEEQIGPLYDSLDIFAFPSLCESFGFPMVEAMAHGLPLAVASTPENLEVTGSAAVSFPPRDADALAIGLRALVTDRDFYREASERSLSRSLAFTWQRAARETIALLEETRR